MKHALSISISLRQPGYTRGQRWWQWVASINHDTYNLDRFGGSGKHVAWGRLTLLGVSLQVNLEHALSNYPAPRIAEATRKQDAEAISGRPR